MRVRSIFLLGLTLLAAGWATLLTFAGGVVLRTPWGRLSSRDPVRPLALAIFAGLVFAFTARADTVGVSARSPWPARLAGIIAVLTLLAGLHLGTFTASGADPSGYVSEAALLREGHLTRAAPAWVVSAPWPDAARTASPLGYAPGPRPGTQVPTYPVGLPLLMATAHIVAGSNGEYYVMPIAGAILIWITYLLGKRVSTPWGGLLAASLVASSPPFLMWVVMPMSDVPVTTCWTLAMLCALSAGLPSAAAAGAATALAILIRPNLVPLAPVVAFLVWRGASIGRWSRLFVYGSVAAIGPVMILVINQAVYGSPFESGYGDVSALYSSAFIGPNIQRYTRWFVSAQTVVPLAGLAAIFGSGRPGRPDRSIVATLTLGVPAVVIASYLPYLPFEDWSYLRFLLPAYPALFTGLAIAASSIVERWGDRQWVRPVVAVIASVVALHGLDYSNAPSDLSRDEQRYRLAAAAVTPEPANTIFVSFQHSGSLRYYTGHAILRWDLMDSRSIDTASADLEGRGFRLVWVGDLAEADAMRQRLAGSHFLERFAASRDARTVAGVRIVDLGAPAQGAALRRYSATPPPSHIRTMPRANEGSCRIRCAKTSPPSACSSTSIQPA